MGECWLLRTKFIISSAVAQLFQFYFYFYLYFLFCNFRNLIHSLLLLFLLLLLSVFSNLHDAISTIEKQCNLCEHAMILPMFYEMSSHVLIELKHA